MTQSSPATLKHEPSARGIRICAVVGLCLTIVVGLASRMEPLRSVPVLGGAFGDGAWVVAVYAVIRFLRPHAKLSTVALAAASIGFVVECSQLWHPAWLDELRGNTLVALAIGRGFLWSDLVAYVVGASCAAGIEWLIRGRFRVTDR